MALRVRPGRSLSMVLPPDEVPGRGADDLVVNGESLTRHGFQHQTQGFLEWCWAGCVSAADTVFGRGRRVARVVEEVTGRSGCSPNPPRTCIVGLLLENLPKAWQLARYRSSQVRPPIQLSELQGEIAARRPVQAHLSRTGHYILFVGWFEPADGGHFVEISDSLRQGIYLDRFDDLVEGLGWSGTVTHISPV